ncbi:hypothetical protein EV360DRAFT_71825 [Lentinula raphanica]|nr:hypothetical protein EV360DRAFT_71825 [Lentinula raphanica]
MRMLNILLPLVTLAICAESHPATPYRSGGAQKRNEPRSEESIPLMTPQEGPTGGHRSPSPPSINSKQPIGPPANGMQARPQSPSMLAKTIEKTEETCVLIGFACCLAFLPSTASMVASGITVGSVPPKTCDCRNAFQWPDRKEGDYSSVRLISVFMGLLLKAETGKMATSESGVQKVDAARTYKVKYKVRLA